MRNTVNHNTLRHLSEVDAITSVYAEADGDIWSLTVLVGDVKKVVMAKNSGEPRKWRKLDTLAKYIQTIGLDKFEINLTNYDATKKSLKRPDSATTLKRTHREAHRSFRIKADKPVEITPEKSKMDQVKEKWQERRMRILREENPRAK